MTQNTEQERAEFEAWAKRMRYLLDRMEDQPESYEEDNTNEAWRGWQAARRAPSVPQLPLVATAVPQGYVLVSEEALQVLGVLDFLKAAATHPLGNNNHTNNSTNS